MEIPRHWRIRKQRYSMVGGSCPNCQTKTFPAREVCPNCGHGSQISDQLNHDTLLYAQPAAVASVVNA
jgi:uncharacterized OB-fold protein